MPVGNAGWNFKDDHDGLSGVHTSEPLLNPTGKPGALFFVYSCAGVKRLLRNLVSL